MTRRDFIIIAGMAAALLAAPELKIKKAAGSRPPALPTRISLVLRALEDAGRCGVRLDPRRANVFLI